MNDLRCAATVLVIGSGIAGLTTALTLADLGVEVILLSSGDRLDDGNTALAQGGIVFQAPNENPRLLEQDILVAGSHHNYLPAVRYLCRRGPKVVKQLLMDRVGVPFSRCRPQQGDADGEWDLTREGGHRVPRIVHCADYTGRAISDSLLRAVKAAGNIRVLTRRTAIDLLTSRHQSRNMQVKYGRTNQCLGAYVYNEERGAVETIFADYTVLATGGLGQIYLHSTNTIGSIGSGLAMAFRAMAWVMNAEFVQFHPTAFYHRGGRRFLITEAMRGEGARLINNRGEPFMERYDPRADLAPRDVVARAVVEEMLATHAECVFLDAAKYVHADLETRFPTVFNMCLERGVDIRKEPIPVVPAAHYGCGGVLVDMAGRSTLERLYAVGECACSGVHGANRLASTSLLEGVVWGHAAARDIVKRLKHSRRLAKALLATIPDWESPGQEANEDPALIAQDWMTIRSTMWNYVGITRSAPRLGRAFEDLRSLYKRLIDFYKSTPLSRPLIDLFHGSHAAYIVTMAAMKNKQSIGCHYRVD